MTDPDDIQLDEETLRQIEEEARREVDDELATNTDLLREIEEEALQEIAQQDLVLDDEFLAELEQELAELSELDIDIDDLDLSDLDLEALVETAAEAPVSTDSGPVDANAADAKDQMRRRVRKRVAAAAAEQIREHGGQLPSRASLDMLEAEIKSSGNTIKAAAILVIVIVAIGAIGVIALLAARLGDDSDEPLAPVTVIQDRSGNVLTPEEVEARKQEAEGVKLFQQVLKVGKRKYQSLDDFKQAKANIEIIRKEYPNLAKEQKEKLEEREAYIDEKLEFYKSMGQ